MSLQIVPPGQRPSAISIALPATKQTKSGPNEWAKAIEKRNANYEVTRLASEGDKYYYDGAWSIKYRGVLTRYVDNQQLEEIYQALIDKNEEAFYHLLNGHGVMFGPKRHGKPPMDKLGKPLTPEPARGDYGDEAERCQWIENHDDVFVEFAGKDTVWPDGCWVIESAQSSPEDDGRQLVSRKQLHHIAHNILGMPPLDERSEGHIHTLMRSAVKSVVGKPEEGLREVTCPKCFEDYKSNASKGQDASQCPQCDFHERPSPTERRLEKEMRAAGVDYDDIFADEIREEDPFADEAPAQQPLLISTIQVARPTTLQCAFLENNVSSKAATHWPYAKRCKSNVLNGSMFCKKHDSMERDEYFKGLGYEKVDFGGGYATWDDDKMEWQALSETEVHTMWMSVMWQAQNKPELLKDVLTGQQDDYDSIFA